MDSNAAQCVRHTSLVIPAVGPAAWAERSVGQEELYLYQYPRFSYLFCSDNSYLAAWLEVFSLGKDTLVVVDVVLPAVLGLVLVREAGVEAWRFVSEKLPYSCA